MMTLIWHTMTLLRCVCVCVCVCVYGVCVRLGARTGKVMMTLIWHTMTLLQCCVCVCVCMYIGYVCGCAHWESNDDPPMAHHDCSLVCVCVCVCVYVYGLCVWVHALGKQL